MLDKRKLAAVFLVPLMMVFVIPVAVHASSTGELYVECFSTNSESSSASLYVLGHSVSVFCPAGGSDAEFHSELFITFSGYGIYSAMSQAGNIVHTAKGIVGPFGCRESGGTLSSTFGAWAFWYIDFECEG